MVVRDGLRDKLMTASLCILILCLLVIVHEQNKLKSCMNTEFIKVIERTKREHYIASKNQSKALLQVMAGTVHLKINHDNGDRQTEIKLSRYDQGDLGNGSLQIAVGRDTTQLWPVGYQKLDHYPDVKKSNPDKEKKLKVDQMSTESNSTTESPEDHLEPSSSRKKVLLFAYMKGGSTFVGQLFNQYPNSMYFYEPVAGFYSALYGSPDWTFPLEVLFNSNGSFRSIPQKEFNSIIRYMKQLYNCDIPHLPIEYLQHQGLWLSSSTYDFRRCLLDQVKEKLDSKSDTKNSLVSLLSKYCPNNIQYCIKKACDVFMDSVRNGDHESFNQSSNSHGVFKSMDFLSDYKHVRNIYQLATDKCISKLHIPCITSNLMVAKALRLTMDMVESLLLSDPVLKVIYLIRDPRGIVVSRKTVQYISQVFEPNIQSEAMLMCPKMAHDYEGYLKLKTKYPKRVMLLRYEDVADQTISSIDQIYNFIGLRPSTLINEWVQRNTHAHSDGEKFSTRRANSSATAHAWRHKISSTVKAKMDLLCADLLHKMGYNI